MDLRDFAIKIAMVILHILSEGLARAGSSRIGAGTNTLLSSHSHPFSPTRILFVIFSARA